MLKYWNSITKKGVFFVTLECPVIDTRPGKQKAEKTATEFLSLLVEMEKKRISKVTEGMKAAKSKGIKPGPKKIKIPPEFYNLKERWIRHEVSSREAAAILGISGRTFIRWIEKGDE